MDGQSSISKSGATPKRSCVYIACAGGEFSRSDSLETAVIALRDKVDIWPPMESNAYLVHPDTQVSRMFHSVPQFQISSNKEFTPIPVDIPQELFTK